MDTECPARYIRQCRFRRTVRTRNQQCPHKTHTQTCPRSLSRFLRSRCFCSDHVVVRFTIGCPLGSMFTHDIVQHYMMKRGQEKMSDKHHVWVGRFFVIGILSITYILSLIATSSIFKLAVWSFTGFSGLFPIVVAALFWKRSTKIGVYASIASVIVLWLYFFIQNWQTPGYTVGGTGIMPVAVIILTSSSILFLVSLITEPPSSGTINKFFTK